MIDEIISGPEVLLSSADPKSCRFCKDIPVPTFLPSDGISLRANHYVRCHQLPIVADYSVSEKGRDPIRFIELGGRRSERAKKILASQGLFEKPHFRPFCPVHGIPMTRLALDSGSFVRFGCATTFCPILWDKPGGYGRYTGHTLPFYSSKFPQCAKLGHGALFIRSSSENAIRWECSINGCSELTTTGTNNIQSLNA